jgi:cell division protease FtsH
MNLKQTKGKHRRKYIIGSIIGLLLIGAVIAGFVFTKQEPPMVSISEIAEEIRTGNVMSIQDISDTGALMVTFEDGTIVKGLRDSRSSLSSQLLDLGVTSQQLSTIKIEVVRSGMSATTRWVEILLPLILFGGIAYVIITMRGTGFGKKNYQQGEIPDVNFSAVAGLDEAVEELRDVVTFLREGDAYGDIGAKTPRGILLVGEPGTGKTLLARAVAGEAGVPFFPISGAEFVEVFVGVGAARVRSLFRKARKSAPCIVFIDEIDAVGRTRKIGGGGGEMEQDQTLNQLLIEMDGFMQKENVIVLAATNREDVLDPALLRPGRFDRRVRSEAPDIAGREAILKVHSAKKKLHGEVDLADIAKMTPGLVGADLENVVNEAAIVAVRNKRREITRKDFETAVEKVLTGGIEYKNRVINPREREIIAYHEAGHAVVMYATDGSDPVYKISIIPRGRLGGFTMALPEQDRLLVSRNQMMAKITSLMGGRAAEEIFFQDITSGAANDLAVATNIAEEMVMRLGMSASGLRVFPRKEGLMALTGSQQSTSKGEEIDAAVEEILAKCYAQARSIIEEKRELVCRVAEELLETETMGRDRFEVIMGRSTRIIGKSNGKYLGKV